ncbi:PD40 domain-containing protein [Paenibacillus sp. HB172176]|uniref:PD40 domain-containing protein n=1 Tax=Paenibacillus sp. HB172176 TaxID=2493690 RepID=UPI00143AC61C|nr:PD40 domain-containing protein [Paenibacillus sp. HB172176]
MPIGTAFPAEALTLVDAGSGRTVRQWTSAKANSYPLYYFIPSITRENDYLVFHSERSGWVQLYRMSLQTGEIAQLTEGRTLDSGWAVFCEHHLRGIYNHLSALNQTRREVYYFQDEELRCTHLDTLKNSLIYTIPGRISIGQSGFSEDGKWFVFVHADRQIFKEAVMEREALENMRLEADFIGWRNKIPSTIGLIHTETGEYKEVIALDYHVHHVMFAGNRIVVNHPKNHPGMWMMEMDGSGVRELRPDPDNKGVNHQVITERGIYYETMAKVNEKGERIVRIGKYDLQTDSYEEIGLTGLGYAHTGWDPAGNFLFFENMLGINGEEGHELFALHYPKDPQRTKRNVLRTMPAIRRGQRFHGHPFLSPDRKWLFYTEVVDGYSQVCAVDVHDLVDLNEYWDA